MPSLCDSLAWLRHSRRPPDSLPDWTSSSGLGDTERSYRSWAIAGVLLPGG
jgi:hypothetical protein